METAIHEPPLKIVHRTASLFGLTYVTDRGLVEAVIDDENRLTCKISNLPPWYQWFHRHERYLPLSVRKLANLYSSMHPLTILLAISIVIFFIKPKAEAFQTFIVSPPSLDAGIGLHLLAIAVVVTSCMLIVHIKRTRSSPWMHAGHMLADTYELHHTLDLEVAAQQAPTDRRHWLRYIIPFIAIKEGAHYALESVSFPLSLLCFLAGLELMFWFDQLYSWDKVPVTGHLSRALQRLLYPLPATSIELDAAQRALKEMLAYTPQKS